jgi:hydrogenase expression/formation protein HypE
VFVDFFTDFETSPCPVYTEVSYNLKPGKVPPEILKTHVFPFLGVNRPEVLVHSKFGEDCSIIDYGEYVAVISSDPITGSKSDIGRLAVHISSNDIAACGAEPLGLTVTILFPKGTIVDEIKAVMEQLHDAARNINVEITGGHTEITSAVTQTVICSTALGIAKKDEYVSSSGARPGDDVLVTKFIGLEGSAILASDFEKKLSGIIGHSVVAKAKGFIKMISVIPESRVAVKHGVTAMHDITEGGVLGASYEVAVASGTGIEIHSELIPLLDETRQICDAAQISPLGLISSGSMLMTVPDGRRLEKALKSAGINAAIIGKVTENGLVLRTKDGAVDLKPPERDELFKAIENLKIVK